jgi:polynucleotide 5'-hydroxyl-kinase GRC3/NOL9
MFLHQFQLLTALKTFVFFFFCFIDVGAGFDMLVEMLRHICPTIVVQIRITMERKNLPDGIFWLDGEQRSEMITINAPFRDASDRS